MNFHKCIIKYLIDLSVPNFNVTDCRSTNVGDGSKKAEAGA